MTIGFGGKISVIQSDNSSSTGRPSFVGLFDNLSSAIKFIKQAAEKAEVELCWENTTPEGSISVFNENWEFLEYVIEGIPQ